MPSTRRDFIRRALLSGAALSSEFTGRLATAAVLPASSKRGGTLLVAQYPEPPTLTSAWTTAGPAQSVSGKIFDGLLTYGPGMTPRPQLATRWEVSSDGLTVTFHLRPGVTWHDGKPFTSADVAFSLMEIWKKYHGRGRSTFANVIAADSPDPLTSIWRLSKPAPYILSALSSVESQVVPQHLYANRDVLSNPYNNAPVGTGPFRFVRWTQGSEIVLERNPGYWDTGKPFLDGVVFRILPEANAAAAALETGAVHIAPTGTVPQSAIGRLGREPSLTVTEHAADYAVGLTVLEFNLDRPLFRDPRVRQAFAHCIDREFILKNIFYGYGEVANSPIPAGMPAFHTGDVPLYPYDLKRAEALLDAAGFKRGADGVRMAFQNDPLPIGTSILSAQFIRATLAKIGVHMSIRSSDYGEFVNCVYKRRDFDTTLNGATAGPDPAIGTQRFYWSADFQPGVAFSNGAHYHNPEVDRVLEAAQVEVDPGKRRALYATFQSLAQTDLPRIPLISPDTVLLANKRVNDVLVSAEGIYGNFASATLAPA